MRKNIYINGLSVQKLIDLKKEYEDLYKRKISFDAIVSKLLLKAKIDDLAE